MLTSDLKDKMKNEDDNTKSILSEILEIKEKYKDKIIIPVHHYQGFWNVQIADIVGDSYKLALDCSKTDKEFIVFCGVLFMAEASYVLKKDFQKVIIPAINADCPMANMANLKAVNEIFNKLSDKIDPKDIAPVVYMNSYSDLKSFCGEKDGSVCTSSNAHLIMDYYIKKGKKVLFFPDRNLGINTAKKLGIDDKNIINSKDIDNYNNQDIIVWDGFCPIHLRFSVGDVEFLRKEYTGIKIIVHPECVKEVNDIADFSGSTEYILKTISNSPAGTVWGVGTETVFVDRITRENPDKTIIPLRDSQCVNMKKTDIGLILKTLKNIVAHIEGKEDLKNMVTVSNDFIKKSKDSLQKMIEIVEKSK